MSQDKKKDSNVIGIGHNQSQNTFSQEQYAKIVNSLHRMLKYSRQEISNVERYLDQAFTKYPFSNPNQPKLKDFEVHEARQEGRDAARKYRAYTDIHIENIEAKAKAQGVELDLNKSEEVTDDNN